MTNCIKKFDNQVNKINVDDCCTNPNTPIKIKLLGEQLLIHKKSHGTLEILTLPIQSN